MVRVLGDFNFRNIAWPDRLNDHGLGQVVHFPTREENRLVSIFTTVAVLVKDIHSPDKLGDHAVISGNLKISIHPIKKPIKKVHLYNGEIMKLRGKTN